MKSICWNKAIITGDETTLKQLHLKFTEIPKSVLNEATCPKLFDTDVSDVEGDDWGSGEFQFKSNFKDNKLIIEGYSTWLPMDGLFEVICQEWQVDCELFYKEQEQDLCGKITWEKDDPIDEEEWTYQEFLFLHQPEEFEILARQHLIKITKFEEFHQYLNIKKWKVKDRIDITKWESLWDELNKNNQINHETNRNNTPNT